MAALDDSTDAGESQRPLGAGRMALLAAIGIMLVSINLRPAVVGVSPVIGKISDTFGFGNGTAGVLTTLPVLLFGVSAPLAPRLAARFGIEWTVLGSLLLLVAGVLLRSVPSVGAVFAGSGLIGVGVGICNVVLPALIKRDFAEHSGIMTGLYSMFLSGGAALAAGLTVPIGDALHSAWQAPLAVWALPAVLAVIVWLPQLRRKHTIAVAATSSGVWRDPISWAITIYLGAQSLIFYTFGAWLPKFLIDETGMSAGAAGGVLAIAQTAGLTASLIAPIVAGRFAGQRGIAIGSLAISMVGFVGLLTTHSLQLLWACIVMIGPGCGIALALLFMVLRTNSSAQAGEVSGMAQSVGYLLAAVGPILIGTIHDHTGSWTVAMTVLAGFALPQGVAALTAGRAGRMAPGPGPT